MYIISKWFHLGALAFLHNEDGSIKQFETKSEADEKAYEIDHYGDQVKVIFVGTRNPFNGH